MHVGKVGQMMPWIFFGNLQVSTHNKHRQITFQKDVQNLHCKL